ncbi:MAG TPA: EAL domain-containing protein [Acidobacteriaceae bacterium]|jgi:PAS domain S-box-containing protein
MPIERSDVDRAITHNEFCPHFQPLVNLRSGELKGFELLARWKHPQQGWIQPNDFIPSAERDGWIDLLTAELLRKGFSAAAALPDGLMLAINISPVQLRDPTLPRLIQNLAELSEFSLGRLVIEITESALTHNIERAGMIVCELKNAGCKLALDDFGTGYSSLSHLQSLPFDELKVDRSFVGAMTEKRDSRKIVAAVVGLGQSLGLTTVAEGVESQEQAEMLRWLGCELGQGWLYGRPAPAEDLATVISNVANKPLRAPERAPAQILRSSLDTPPAQRLAQLQAVYDGAPVGLAFLDRDLRYMNLNRRLATMNGRPLEDHLGRTVAEMIPELFPLVEPDILRALNGESVTGVELVKPATGPNAGQSILQSFEPARDEGGEVVGVSVALVDITPIKRAEDARRESETHLRHMMELLPQIPWILDAEGRALDVSQRWLELTGMTDEQWRGFGWMNAVHPEDLQAVWDTMRNSFETGQAMDVEYRVRRSSEAPWKRMRARGSASIGDDGKIAFWYGCLEPAEEAK